jgi:putative transposase
VRVTARNSPRLSVAALICVKPGCRPRLIYRTRTGRRHQTGQRKGFTETAYAWLLDDAHQQLGGPLVVVWDNLNTHVSAAMAGLIAARDWLTVYQLPPYAHELNPVEPVWSHLKRSLANLAKIRHHPAGRAGEDPAQEDAIPAQPHPRLPRQHRARPHALFVTPTIKDL